MANFSLDVFREFINSVPDDIFPGSNVATKRKPEQMTDDELQQLIIDVIHDYPEKYSSGKGAPINAIYQLTGTLKYKSRTQKLLQHIFELGIAAEGREREGRQRRWYIVERN